MKHIIRTSITAAVLLSVCGCYKLDRFPESKFSQANYWATPEQVDMAMNGVYAIMYKTNGMGVEFAFDCLGGISVTTDNTTYLKVFNGTYTSTISKIVTKFKLCYESVQRANNIIRNLKNCELSEEQVNRYKAEARFLRALFYFEMSGLYGGVPIYDESWDVGAQYNEMLLPRNTLEEVYEFIHKDLEFAIKYLPAQWEPEYRGRATWGAAAALQGKVYMFEGRYKEAAGYLQDVIDSGLYHLNPDYGALFTIPGDACDEMIFYVSCCGDLGMECGLPLTYHLGTKTAYGNCSGNTTAATQFVDTYEYKDGRPFSWETAFPGLSAKDIFTSKLASDLKTVTYTAHRDELLKLWEDRDPRMAATVILPYTHYLGNVGFVNVDTEYIIATGVTAANGFVQPPKGFPYPYRKFVATGDLDGLITDPENSPINFPLIRLADVYLMLAECKIGLDDIPGACDCINVVRKRAGVALLNSGNENLKATTKEEATRRLRLERRWELAGEGHSFTDLKRYGELESVAGTYNDILGTKLGSRVVIERDNLWPIPIEEINMNPSLEQNPGW